MCVLGYIYRHSISPKNHAQRQTRNWGWRVMISDRRTNTWVRAMSSALLVLIKVDLSLVVVEDLTYPLLSTCTSEVLHVRRETSQRIS